MRTIFKTGFSLLFAFLLFKVCIASTQIWLVKVLYGFIVGQVDNTIAVNPLLVKGMVSASLVPVLLLLNWGGAKKSLILIAVIGFSFFNLIMYVTTRDLNFDPNGQSTKKYSMRGDGIALNDSRAAVDQETGVRLKDITPEIAQLNQKLVKTGFRKMDPRTAPWYNTFTGKAELFYGRNHDGQLEFFNLPLSSPSTGEKLLPVTNEVFKNWKKQEEEDKRAKEVENLATEVIKKAEVKQKENEMQIAARYQEDTNRMAYDSLKKVEVEIPSQNTPQQAQASNVNSGDQQQLSNYVQYGNRAYALYNNNSLTISDLDEISASISAHRNVTDPVGVEALAWLCLTLEKSGQGRYIQCMREVGHSAASARLREYALAAARTLQEQPAYRMREPQPVEVARQQPAYRMRGPHRVGIVRWRR